MCKRGRGIAESAPEEKERWLELHVEGTMALLVLLGLINEAEEFEFFE